MMRAWRGRARLRGAVAAPNLAHRIATNVPFTELEHPPRRVLMRDVLGWSSHETAALLETSTASVNSALQRARSTMRERIPERRLERTA
jgi:DNA-directed RNA polymerase specialized sigma24 family protein